MVGGRSRALPRAGGRTVSGGAGVGPGRVEVENHGTSVTLRFDYASQFATKEGRERAFHTEEKGSYARRTYRVRAEVTIPVVAAADAPVAARAKECGEGLDGARVWRTHRGRPLREVATERQRRTEYDPVTFDDILARVREVGGRFEGSPFLTGGHPRLEAGLRTPEERDVREVRDDALRAELEALRDRASRMAIVDGTLWEPCGLPVWEDRSNTLLVRTALDRGVAVSGLVLPVESGWLDPRPVTRLGVIVVEDPSAYRLDEHLAEVGAGAVSVLTKSAFKDASVLPDEAIHALVDLRRVDRALHDPEGDMSPADRLEAAFEAIRAFPAPGFAEGHWEPRRFLERVEASARHRVLDGLEYAPCA